MKIIEEDKNDVSLCSIKGDVTMDTSPQLRKHFDALIKRGIKKVVIDFSDVSYVDSSALATLIELLRRLNKTGGTLRLSSLQASVENVFEVTKLHTLFSIYPSRDLALEGF